VALIGESAVERDLAERVIRVSEQSFCLLDAPRNEPSVRSHSGGRFEGLPEMTAREAAVARQLADREIAAKSSVDELEHSTLLTRRQAD
jgi:hypothetical protein